MKTSVEALEDCFWKNYDEFAKRFDHLPSELRVISNIDEGLRVIYCLYEVSPLYWLNA
jgi:hypothetical protein